MEKQRLSKIMAQRGLCSRREADRYIERGLVLVDGVLVNELGTRIDPSQEITLLEAAEKQQSRRVTILLNKPVGYVSGQPEKNYRSAVELIRPDTHWKNDRTSQKFDFSQRKGLSVAGRLDIDSTGLLVLTQDGRVARRIIGEDSSVEKEYLVRVKGTLVGGGLELLRHGLSLDGKKLKSADVRWQNRDQLRFVLHEGKKRQIRRMCELVGLKVTGLKRVRVGRVRLENLPQGQWRYLRSDEKF
jgi:23S rRNA pseudouridine2604 synthase